MKTILGLDLGTNSIGWALIQHNFENKKGKILGMGSRILPMSQDVLGKFDSGQSISQTAERTGFRGVRRLLERDLLRRERLHRVLNILGFLPEHYADEIDFEHRLGQFKKDKEPKIAYRENQDNKFEFNFKASFDEMVTDFRETQPQLFYLKPNGEETKIPYDWTIYYLRKKALSQKIEKEELAWILLNFNQKRGYYQLRGEEEEVEDNKEKSFEVLTVSEVVDSGEKIKGKDIALYDVYFDNGWKYDKQIAKPEDWIGKTKEFIVTTSQLASGETKRTFKAVDSEQDWIAIKQKTEQDISVSNKTVGEYIYDTLLQKPNQKIRGKLVRTIERKFYKIELLKILEKQKEFHPELQSKELYNACVEELYAYNEAHRNSIANRDFTYLFLDDIIFYQRPLKSKKSLISNCSLEFRTFKVDGVEKREGIKCIAKSNPLYQEFRLLQWVKNLKIFKKDDKQDIDVTDELLPTIADRETFFEWLNDKTEIDQKTFLKYPDFNLEEKIRQQLGMEQFRIFKKDKEQGLHTYYRWNYVEDKKYPLNETRGEILKRLIKAGIESNFLNKENETHLWHILYSVEDKNEIESALNKFATKHDLPDMFVEIFKKYPRIDKDYGAFSEKAIKKLLPLMRFGKWWDFSAIDEKTKNRIDKILTGEYDEKMKNRVREKAIGLSENDDFKNLPIWLASYIVYNRHSETSDVQYWRRADDIELLKQHSLRNPIVEQVINETLRTIREIWQYYGNGEEKFFDEIHVELGREMKNPADKRRAITERVTENENTN
ncbi:MAG: type II CRISPR RNA-guided endonuclease Cas9, partial [Petrimonas sp.]|nr:type II CRISPR RNA-guided endonuclease Cas9 [Petrimonas sp.]